MRFVEYQLKARNTLHTIFIFVAMCSLLVLIGYLILGLFGALFAILLAYFAFSLTPRLSPDLILRLYQARKLEPLLAIELYELVDDLRRKAGLKEPPQLYYLPSTIINSFTIGDKENYKIILSDGLLRNLSARELYGVLAHEISHVKNNDLQVMTFADVMSRVTSMMALAGILSLMLTLPLILMGEVYVPVLGLLLLTFAPNITALLQLALSRTREFIADQEAVKLTADPLGLASALQKIEAVEKHWTKRILLPQYKLSEPSLLRTHPLSEERIKRLVQIANEQGERVFKHDVFLPQHLKTQPALKKPRHRIHGMWY